MSKHEMRCPGCGSAMNYHAEKIDYSVSDPAVMDPVFGGAIEETYFCPQCNRTETRLEKS